MPSRRVSGCPILDRGERQGAHQDPLRELDLELVVTGRLGVGKCGLCRAVEGIWSGTGARQHLFGRASSPWFGGNTAEREPGIPDRALFDP